jgi:hypothetical protein
MNSEIKFSLAKNTLAHRREQWCICEHDPLNCIAGFHMPMELTEVIRSYTRNHTHRCISARVWSFCNRKVVKLCDGLELFQFIYDYDVLDILNNAGFTNAVQDKLDQFISDDLEYSNRSLYEKYRTLLFLDGYAVNLSNLFREE